MARPKKEMKPELKVLIEQDIAKGVKRGVICKAHGVSYLDLSREFGHTCKKPRLPKAEPVESPVDGWPSAS